MLLDGLHIPLTTPFYPDGRVYYRKLEHNVGRYSLTPAASLIVATRTGERSLLSEVEMRGVMRTAIDASAATKGMIADVSRDGVLNTLELADFAAELGYDAILLELPGVLSADLAHRKSQLTYFQAVADRSPLPIVLGDGDSLTTDLIAELSANPAFLGAVVASGSIDRLHELRSVTSSAAREVVVTQVFAAVTRRMRAPQETPVGGNYIDAGALSSGATALATAPPAPAIKTRTKRVGFQLLTGRTSSLAASLAAGVVGAVLPFAVCAPQAVYEVLAAWKDGDPGLAAEKQQRLHAAAEEIEGRLGAPGLKAASDLNGYYGGRPRLPLLPVSGGERTRIDDLMAGMRN